MNLLTKTGIYYTALSALLFAAGGILFYYLVKNELREEIEEHLISQKNEIINDLHRLARISPVARQFTVKAVSSIPDTNNVFRDTTIYDYIEKEFIPFCQLIYHCTNDSGSFHVTLYQSLIESEDLLESMTFAMILVFIVLVIGMGLLNVLLLRRIWHPFYDTLSKLQFFDSNSQTALPLSKSSIKEFNNLNGVIKKMTERIRRDFSNLKEFTENASHELQTPLAIISSKLENILDNSDHLPIRHVKCIKEVHNTINRLTQLNRGLLLLTRIEGGRFSNREQVSIRAEIEAQLDQFEELIALKKISLQTSFNSQLSVFIHPSLTTVLVSTLLTNAILHNFENGSIKVEISGPVLLIENTGARLNVTTESLFERFKKGNQASSSIGLGLSIAKKICDKHKFDLSYKNVDTLHSISVTF